MELKEWLLHKDNHLIVTEFDSLKSFDMRLADPVSRSMRLNGKSTCIRLERLYWTILGYAAFRRDKRIGELLSHLDREVQLCFGGVTNFSSLVRVISLAEVVQACPDLAQWLALDRQGR